MSVITGIIIAVISVSIGVCVTYFTMNAVYKKKMFNKEIMYMNVFNILLRKNIKSQHDNEAKNDYLASMVHDIRTPINTVVGMNEMILRENNDIEINEYANNIKRASNILVELVNDILDISKIESGNMELVESSYDVCELLNDVISIINDKCNRKSLKFEISIDSSIPCILYGDENKIKQILLNLLTNAVKYTQTGKVRFIVKVMNRSGADGVELFMCVEDTGSGIHQEDIKSIFKSFNRTDEKKNAKIEGTGLGLNIVYHLLKLMNSKIELQSEYGVGSKFYFLLNQKTIDNKPIGNFMDIYRSKTVKRSDYEVSFIAPKARVLVVDDNEMNLLVVSKLLKNTKMQIDTVSSGYGCLGKINEFKYDVILMDIKMPELDGEETFKCIREGDSINRNTPVIALTADAVIGVEEKYLEEGFTDYISKPIDAIKLETTIGKYVVKESINKNLDEKEIEDIDVQYKELESKIIVEDKGIDLLIDRNIGMEYCSNDSEMYSEVLKAYLNMGEDNISNLNLLYNNQDWVNYNIQIHSLKSTSLTVGAKTLSALAKQLEEASSSGDIQFIIDNHNMCMEIYEKVLNEVRNDI